MVRQISTQIDPARHENACFVLRISLDHMKPPIWRRIVVPSSITLDLLHDALNVAMGWEDHHLHQFEIGGRRFTEAPEEPEQGEDESGIVLGSLVFEERSKFTYLYDFGDGWQHTVLIEQVDAIPPGRRVDLTCLGGRRRCPPEDVGGPPGYEEYLHAISDRKHPEHKHMLEWHGPFDAEAFDADVVNRDLARLARWSRPRKR